MNAPRSLESRMFRERAIWIVSVTVLVSTTAWLGALVIALAARSHGNVLARAMAVARVLLETALAFRQELLAVLAAVIAMALLVGMLLRAEARGGPQGVHHA